MHSHPQLNGLQPVLCEEMSQLQQFENRWQLAFFSSLNDVTSQVFAPII